MKAKRRLKIREIIAATDIETQEELAEALRQAGFSVTQATVSRDIKEMGLVKIPTADGRYKYALPGTDKAGSALQKLRRALEDSFIKLDYADHFLVLKTSPGNAHAVAALIDQLDWPEVMGTLGGEKQKLFLF
ncbi:MAG: arginine repressor, partial [Bacillaceae bacterium G1]